MLFIKQFKEELSQSDNIQILHLQKEIIDLKISILSTEDEEEKKALQDNVTDITDRIANLKGI